MFYQGTAIELSDVALKEILADMDGQPLGVKTILRRGERGREFSICSERSGSSPREHCRGLVIDPASAVKAPARARIEDLTAGLVAVPLPAQILSAAIRLGPRWRCLRRVWRGEGEGVAELELPTEYAAELEQHPLHPALLDCALSFIGLWLPAIYVPYGYKTVRIFAALPQKLSSQIYYAIPDGELPEQLELDVTLRDLLGTPLVEIKGYSLRRLHDRSR